MAQRPAILSSCRITPAAGRRAGWRASLAVLAAILVVGTAFGIVPGLDPAATPSEVPSHPGSMASAAGATLLQEARASVAAGDGPANRDGPTPTSSQPLAGAAPAPGVSLVYDAADGYVLAATVGLSNGTWGSSMETWTFLHGNWTQLDLTSSPSNRDQVALTYDPIDRYVVLFGGVLVGGFFGYLGRSAETWTYSNGTWTNLTGLLTTAPPAQQSARIAWDTADGYAVLTDGFGSSGNLTGNLSECWTFVAGAWTSRTAPAGLAPEGAMAYDAADGYVLFFGGTTPTGFARSTWKYSAGSWTDLTSLVVGAPSARAGSAMTFDPNLGAVLLFGGLTSPKPGTFQYLNDSWTYSNLTWTLLSSASGPGPRDQSNLVYDAADNASILFGGYNQTTAFSDTWAFNSTGNGSSGNSSSWTKAAPHIAFSHLLDEQGYPVTLTVTGVQGTGASYRYAGLPPGCASVDADRLTCTPSAPGNYTIMIVVNSTGGIASAAALLSVAPPLLFDSFSQSVSLTEVGGTDTLTVAASSGVAPYAYRYVGLPPGCVSVNTSSLVCTPSLPGNFSVGVTVSDAFTASVGGSLLLLVRANPSIASLRLAPSAIDLGQTAGVTVELAGGIGPYTYAYTNLPAGCTSGDASSLQCRPSLLGTFGVGVTVTDWLGFQAAGSIDLIVNPDPTISNFTSSASNVTTGSPVTFDVTTTGGTGPFSFSYLGLPDGCTSVNTSALTCVPSAAGTYSIQAAATDSAGWQLTASLVQTVSAPIVLPRGPHPNPGSSNPGTNGSAAPDTASLFYTGIALGLIALALGAGTLLWRARLARQGRELVRQMRRSPLPSTSDRGKGGPPAGGDPPSGPTDGAHAYPKRD